MSLLLAAAECTGAESNPWTDVIGGIACCAAVCFIVWLLVRG